MYRLSRPETFGMALVYIYIYIPWAYQGSVADRLLILSASWRAATRRSLVESLPAVQSHPLLSTAPEMCHRQQQQLHLNMFTVTRVTSYKTIRKNHQNVGIKLKTRGSTPGLVAMISLGYSGKGHCAMPPPLLPQLWKFFTSDFYQKMHFFAICQQKLHNSTMYDGLLSYRFFNRRWTRPQLAMRYVIW